MKAIILAAGKGRRLYPLTKSIPKCLLRIKGKPLLHYQIELLKRRHIEQISIVVGFKREAIESYCDRYFSGLSIKFIFNPFFETTNSLVSMWFARGEFTGDFVYMHSDILFDASILSDVLCHRGKICVAAEYKKCDKEDLKIRTKRDRLIEINKKMPLHEAKGEFIGIGKFSKGVAPLLLKALDDSMRRCKFMDWFELSWQQFSRKQAIDVINVGDRKWIEIDTLQDYKKALHLFERREETLLT